MMTANLAGIFGGLSGKERALLTRALNQLQGKARIHAGNLPFVSAQDALEALLTMNDPHKGIFVRLEEKLRRMLDLKRSCHVTFNMNLHDGDVLKRFGQRPECGINIPTLPNLPCKEIVKRFGRDVQVDSAMKDVVTLEKIPGVRHGWRVACREAVREKVADYLMNTCVPGFGRPEWVAGRGRGPSGHRQGRTRRERAGIYELSAYKPRR